MLEIKCENCSTALAVDSLKLFTPCPKCRVKQQVILFSAIEQESEKGLVAEAVLDDDAACINHPDKAAAVLCSGCGAYVCNLCDIEIEDQHLCPKCFNNRVGKISSVSKKTALYDSRVLSLAFFSILIGPLSLITAPIAVGMTLFYWNKMNTPYPRGKWRFIVALLVALSLLIGWGLWLLSLIFG